MKELLLLCLPLISFNLSGQCLDTNSYGSALANAAGPVAISRCNYLTQHSTISTVDISTRYKCEVASPDLNSGYNTITGNIIVIPGCTDTTACNYNAIATTDDGSCMYFITSTDSIVTCDSSYTWLLNGQTFITSGTYTHFNSYPAPILMGTYSNSVYGNVSVSGNYAYVAGGSSGLAVIDISNPSAPTLTSTYNASGGYVNGVSVSGNYAYVAGGSSGLVIIDISNPLVPTLTSTYNTSGGYANGVSVSGNYAYVADGSSGLDIFDISNPLVPILAGNLLFSGGLVSAIYVSGDYAYITEGYGNSGLILIIDISNPSAPTLAGTYNAWPFSIDDIYVSGDYAYVAGGSYGLAIIDISNSSIPALINTCLLYTSPSPRD